MRITVSEFISLDGVVQAPGHPDEDTDGGFAHGGWSHRFFDPELVGGAFATVMANVDALVYGRRTYETMAAAWPARAGDPLADFLNPARKYVVTDTLGDDDLTWENSTRIPGTEAIAELRKMRESEGRDLGITGSAQLVRALLAEGLVDELRLIVMPVVLGGGKTIFPADGGLSTFKLTSATTAKNGAQALVYELVPQA